MDELEKSGGTIQRRVTDWIRTHALGVARTSEFARARADYILKMGALELCRNRLVFGTLRYEQCGRTKYYGIRRAIDVLNSYGKTGNREFLVDAINYCLLEWAFPSHENPHWESIDDGEHAEEI